MTSILNLSASNGDGEAVKANVTATRSIGVTTLRVDSVTNWPAEFIATSGVLNGQTGYLDPATMVVFYGHLSGANIIIDSFADGYSDIGNAVADVVVLKPTTAWVDVLVEVIKSLYPIGSIYTETTGVNPATTFGFGTWTAFGAGKVLVGKNTTGTFATAGATGGEETHLLTVPEIPAHKHPVWAGQNSFAVGASGSTFFNGSTGNYEGMSNTGGGRAHNNLQPYVVVYMWHRDS